MTRVLRTVPAEQLSIFASVDDVRDAAAVMPSGYLACRELGHPWGAYVATLNQAENYFERTLRCPRCTTLKIQTLSRSGHILGSHYQYPDDYLMDKGLGRIVGDGRDALRLEALTRAVQQPEPPEPAKTTRTRKGKAA